MKSEFDSFSKMLQRRWLIVVTIIGIGIFVIPLIVANIPTYKGTANLLIVNEALKDTSVSDPDLPTIVTSTEVLNRVIDRLGLHTVPFQLAKRITTKLPPKSSILSVTYKDTNAEQAALVANTIADVAAAYFHEVATHGYADVIGALERRIADSQEQVARADRRLQSASARNAFSSSDKALDDLTSQIDELRAQRGQANSALAADQATADALGAQLSRIQPIVRGEILQKDVVYQQIQADLAKDVADLSSERSSFNEDFPGLSALEKRVQRERAQLNAFATGAIQRGTGSSPSYTQTVLDRERAEGQVSADRERLGAIDAELADEQDHLQQVAGAGASVGTLRAERDAALQQYISLTQRLSAAQGDAAQAASLGTLVVVSRAIPGPSSLSLWIAVIAAAIVGLAFAIAYLVDIADRRFWGVSEMEKMYGRPVLAEVVK